MELELNALYHCVASLDVHQAVVIVCIVCEDEAGKIHVQLREFGAFKRDRKAMAEWVASFQPQQVVMESTRYMGITKGSTKVVGVGTQFTRIGNEVFIITTILGDTELTIDVPHTAGAPASPAYTDSNLLSVESGAEVKSLVIDKSGNVGIGKAPNAVYQLDVQGAARVDTLKLAGKAACEKLQTDASGNVQCGKDADSGTITGVTAGDGLSGGGVSGTVSLRVDNTQVQRILPFWILSTSRIMEICRSCNIHER
uniref:Uncharacterized protein n=1 Tax=Candidatus Kentrum sp. LPFa TaxID=2126335 RepID=A0A450XV80_9GAMM|nr:MAG: hypothetical protein BECKLPF1236C_GA0070990_101942 [Candidatus Kentron sp. LPFa]